LVIPSDFVICHSDLRITAEELDFIIIIGHSHQQRLLERGDNIRIITWSGRRTSMQREFAPNAGQVPAVFVVAPQAAHVQDDPIQPAEL